MSHCSGRFRLLRQFSVQSALVTVIAALAMVLIYERHERTAILEAAERQNVALARAFANAIATDRGFHALSLDDATAFERVHARMVALTRDLPVHKVKIFDAAGRTAYSSDRGQIGQSAATNAGFRQAVDQRKAASKTSFRGSFTAFSRTIANVHLAETYVPIVAGDGSLASVFELYTDITGSISEIETEAAMAAVLVALALGLHFLASLFIVARADRIIAQQHEKLTATNAEVQTARAHLSAALTHMAHGLTMFDEDGRLVVVNERFLEHYGLPKEAVPLGISATTVEERVSQRGFLRRPSGTAGDQNPARVELSDGSRIVSVVRGALPSGGSVSTHEDVTEQRRFEQTVVELANTDHLTHLANRHHIETVATKALGQGAEAKGALLLVDLDGFKDVNDTHGHLIGDRLLQGVAERLRACRTPHDLIGRLGGDEFAVLQFDAAQPDRALALGEEIAAALRMPFAIGDKTIRIGASVGISLLREAEGSLDTLLQQADAALYEAKRAGKDGCRLFDQSVRRSLAYAHIVSRDLAAALSQGQIDLVYQPVCDARTLEIRSVEALARWHHPVLGIVNPVDFIPLAERSGLIHELGAYVIARACRDAAQWPPHVRVGVNLSPLQFERPEALLATIEENLTRNGLAPGRLIVEVTEGLLLKDDGSLDLLMPLQEAGLTIALDDFGKGYANLDYLHRFRFDKLKIDGSFIASLETSAQSVILVESILELARKLGIATVAEGVDSERLVVALREMGCTALQGFAVSLPLTRAQLEAHFEARDCARVA